MAFPATAQITANAFVDARSMANNIRIRAQTASTVLQSTSSFDVVWDIRRQLVQASIRLTELKAVPGLAQYARDQNDDQTLDIVAEFNALIAAVDDAANTIDTLLPKDGNDYLLVYKVVGTAPYSNSDVNFGNRTFTPGQTSEVRTKLDTVVAAVS